MTDPTTSAALAHLAELSTLHPDLSSSYYSPLSTLYSKKLWHQLTVSTLEFLSDPSTLRLSSDNASSNHLTLLHRVLLPMEKKLNSLSLVRMASLVAFSLPSDGGSEVLRPLLKGDDGNDRFGPAAVLYLTSRYHLLQLSALADKNNNHTTSTTTATTITDNPEATSVLESIASSISSSRSTLDQLADTESESSIVHSAYYETSMYYYKAVGPPESYYKEALRYVSYTDLNDVSDRRRYDLAVDLSLAALTGEGVFNFGEITASPLLHALKSTESEYLATLLECGARGDVVGFRSSVRRHSDAVASHPSLASRIESVVMEKITLSALVNMVFERPALERTLRFEDVAERTEVPEDRVEWVVMRALSLHLIEGSMDEVERTVDVTWVVPRVLDGGQRMELAARFGEWAGKVGKTRDYMLEHAGALLNQ